MPDNRPNILYIMTDQQRWDTISALGNSHIYTPNLDRLVARGISFTQGYSTCPVCIPARYTIRTGCEPFHTAFYSNAGPDLLPGQAESMEERCGPYLSRRLKELGYRTFGIGKFHTIPTYEDLGFEIHLHSEELYSPGNRHKDAYARWIAEAHPEYDWLEMLQGERTEMYYMPQMSPMPAELTVENWAAERAVEQINAADQRPWYGFVSFIGPHPPLAPPLPFNRMYNPDTMPNPVKGVPEVDHMDEQIPRMNHVIWAEDIPDWHARILKTRYYGEITYIDQCLGKILDALETTGKAENTLICFFADHGDHMGDHSAWQKESFFDACCRVPFLVSWPERLPAGETRTDLACLTDLFAIATRAATGVPEVRDGHDILGMLLGEAEPREYIFGYYRPFGDQYFKMMVRDPDWKYIWMANGGHEQLFHVTADPHEIENAADANPDVLLRLREAAVRQLQGIDGAEVALAGNKLKAFPYAERERKRVIQMDRSRDVNGWPEKPEAVLQQYKEWVAKKTAEQAQ